MAQKILPPEGGIDPPGRSDPEVEGRWKLLDRLPNEADRQGLRGWLALRMSLTWSLLLFSNHGCQVHSLTFSWFFVRPGCRTEGGMAPSSEKGMLWLAVRAFGLCVQTAHTDTLAGPMRLVTTLPDGLCGLAPALPLRSLQVAMMTCQPSQSTRWPTRATGDTPHGRLNRSS